ncbi:MAG TPA: hypothetical protein VG889_18905 [Rhizomicrobium sp.]|nr:hypothetical protein [Rhizomicrobium sp.]
MAGKPKKNTKPIERPAPARDFWTRFRAQILATIAALAISASTNVAQDLWSKLKDSCAIVFTIEPTRDPGKLEIAFRTFGAPPTGGGIFFVKAKTPSLTALNAFSASDDALDAPGANGACPPVSPAGFCAVLIPDAPEHGGYLGIGTRFSKYDDLGKLRYALSVGGDLREPAKKVYLDFDPEPSCPVTKANLFDKLRGLPAWLLFAVAVAFIFGFTLYQQMQPAEDKSGDSKKEKQR